MIHFFSSLFIILSTFNLVLGRPVSTSYTDVTNKDSNIKESSFPFPPLFPGLPMFDGLPKLPKFPELPKLPNFDGLPKSFEPVKPVFPPFGDLSAPRISSDPPKGHGPLSEYTLEKLKNLSKPEAYDLKNKLIREQLKKDASFSDNLLFLYLLDEAFYDAGVSMDADIDFIKFKIDELANNSGTKTHDELRGTSSDKANEGTKGKGKGSEKTGGLDPMVARRYLLFSKLTYLKRYIDHTLKELLPF